MKKIIGGFIMCIIVIICFTSCSKKDISNQITEDVTSSEDKKEIPTITPAVTLKPEIRDYDIEQLTEVQKIVDSLMPSYDTMYRALYTGLETGNEEMVEDEYGNRYLVLQHDVYKSVDDIVAMMETVLTEEYSREKYYGWVIEGQGPKFKEIDGELCVAMTDAVGAKLQPDVLDIEKISDSEMILLMQWETNEGLEDILVTIKNIDSNWRINDIMNPDF